MEIDCVKQYVAKRNMLKNYSAIKNIYCYAKRKKFSGNIHYFK